LRLPIVLLSALFSNKSPHNFILKKVFDPKPRDDHPEFFNAD
jgi:hypothetical protein